ncbi:STAS domain-containing protein [soil metagenome]
MGNLPQCLIHDEWRGRRVVISCAGIVDMLTAPELEQRIAKALALDPTAMVVDLTLIDFFASRGMGVLVDTHDQCSAAGVRFAVVADGPVTHRPLTLMGLTDILNVHLTLDSALTNLQV